MNARTLWLAVLLGAAVGVVSGLYLRAVRFATELVWDGTDPRIPGHGRWQIVVVCVLGGALVGLLRARHDRDTPHDLEDALQDLDEALGGEAGGARQPLKRVGWLIRAALLGVVSLAAGASLGPEAPLLMLATGLGERLARILRTTRAEAAYISSAGALSGLFGGPLGAVALPVERGRSAPQTTRLIGAGLVAGVAGLVGLLVVVPSSAGRRYVLPDLGHQSGPDLLREVGWAALAALPATLAGVLLLLAILPSRRLAERLVPATVPRAAVGGLVLGVCGTLDALCLFSGEHQGQHLIDSVDEKTAAALLVLVVLKLVATLACLSTGWFGGQIFPAVFAGMAAGLAVAALWPAAPVGAVAAAGAGAGAAAVLRRPLAVVLILLFFFPADALLPLAVGTALGTLAVGLLGDRVPEPQAH